MSLGGKRPGAGRPPGRKNKRTVERQEELKRASEKIAAATGEAFFEGDAHALLMSVYKDSTQPIKMRMDAATACIGYEKPKLTSVDASIEGVVGHYESQPIPVEERDPLEGSAGPAAGSDQASHD